MGRDARRPMATPRPAAEEVLAVIDRLGVDELHARQASAAADILTMGITFTRVLRRHRHRPGVAVRCHPASDRGHRVGPRRARARPAAGGAQPLHRRRLQRAPHRRRRRVPGRPARRLVELPAGVPGRPPEVRGVGPHLRLRPRARRRRHDVRARGQPPRAVRRQLRPREPGRRQAGVPRAVRPPDDRPRRRLHRRAEQAARVAGPRRRLATRRSPCSRQASSTPPTSSTPSSPSGWAPRSSRAATSS